MEEFEEVESSEMGEMVLEFFEIIAVNDLTRPTTISRGREKNIKVVHNEVQIILYGLY